METLLMITIGAALVNNVVLSQFLGLCPFVGVSKKIETAAGMGGAVMFVLILSSAVTGLLYTYVLEPASMEYLQTIVFILVIACLVQFVEMFLKKMMPPLYNSLGVFLPLITTNCAVLGVSINNVTKNYSVFTGIINGVFTAVGFMIAIVIMAGIREKTEHNDIPASWKGTPLVLIVSGLMAMAFFGFSGLI
ncbi:MAG: electron transport complex subunit RsxA [Epulopiscium sp. Nuni2H_MBin003]|nr:MAG: electron transport complex subunit RsxA [Epulopiscium sp. Nuni2H_MBin003]